MKNISIEVGLLKQFVMSLIVREFGSLEVFNQEFSIMAPRVMDIPRTGNPVITLKQFKDELDQVVQDQDWPFHICAMWKIVLDLENI